ncbi:MAG: pirin family protein [Vicinamibacterales bacterium]
MLTIRKAEDRGHTDLGWLSSYHTFSFGGYQDPAHMGFRALRVLNDDRVEAAKGFGAHGHREMEILSYVIAGTLAHRDSMEEERNVAPDEIQTMSAGTGVIHSEFNPSPTEPVHFLQIWIEPAQSELTPSYQHVSYPRDEKRGRLRLVAGPDMRTSTSAVHLHQDARIYAALLGPGESVTHAIPTGRHAWIQCATGGLIVNGVPLKAGDGLAVSDEARLTITATRDAELLVFDLV